MLYIIEWLPVWQCVVVSFLRVGNYVIDGGARLLGSAVAVEFVGIAKLMLCDPDGEFGAVFGPRAFEARFEFVDGFVLSRRTRDEAKGYEIYRNGQPAHGHQCFFGSIAISRCRACHS